MLRDQCNATGAARIIRAVTGAPQEYATPEFHNPPRIAAPFRSFSTADPCCHIVTSRSSQQGHCRQGQCPLCNVMPAERDLINVMYCPQSGT